MLSITKSIFWMYANQAIHISFKVLQEYDNYINTYITAYSKLVWFCVTMQVIWKYFEVTPGLQSPNYSRWITDDKDTWEIPILAFPSDNIFNTKYLPKYILLELAIYDEYIFRHISSGTMHLGSSEYISKLLECNEMHLHDPIWLRDTMVYYELYIYEVLVEIKHIIQGKHICWNFTWGAIKLYLHDPTWLIIIMVYNEIRICQVLILNYLYWPVFYYTNMFLNVIRTNPNTTCATMEDLMFSE